MNLTDLQAIATASGIPFSIIILGFGFWHVIGKWIRDEYLPRLASAREKQADGLLNISKLVETLLHETRESRRVSEANSRQLSEVIGKVDALLDIKKNPQRAGNSRARGE